MGSGDGEWGGERGRRRGRHDMGERGREEANEQWKPVRRGTGELGDGKGEQKKREDERGVEKRG